MKKVIIALAACICTCSHAQSLTPAQNEAVEKAKQEINRFIDEAAQKSSCNDFTLFLQHLPYYRMWLTSENDTVFQLVAPAPLALEEKITPALRKLEATLKAIVRAESSFIQEVPEHRLGGSHLTAAGDQFFSEILSYAQAQQCPPRKKISFHFGSPSRYL